uniref:Uncharacterized protein n=1 Tax=Picea sitchensis TaxID=3332 RepID=A0A6B9XX30_PICSI|nr:hypothetical protein Q903MT_gene5722 [Picea sitchensis]
MDERLRSSPLTQRMGERLCSSPVGREFAASPFWSSHLTYLLYTSIPNRLLSSMVNDATFAS